MYRDFYKQKMKDEFQNRYMGRNVKDNSPNRQISEQ